MSKINWMETTEAHDYTAATDYLSLLMPATEAQKLSKALMAAEIVEFKAKDILRSSRLPLLGEDNHHVKHDQKKISDGTPMPPILLVRGSAKSDRPLIVADGYHRVCAIELLNEDLPIRCQIIDLAI